MTEPEFNDLLSRYLAGKASSEEKKLLDRFFDSYRLDAGETPLIDDTVKHEMYREIGSRIPTDRSFINSGTLLRIAASVTLIALAVYFLYPRKQAIPASTLVTEAAPPGQKLSITLEDGTTVMLNGGSAITYTTHFSENVRQVQLKGEGYFDVTPNPDKPFIITAGITSITVLGTSFNVNAISGQRTMVTLVEGKVKVKAPGDSTLLTPGEQATVDSQSGVISTSKINVERFSSWKENTIWFEETSLKDAIAVLENWYGVKISLQNKALESCVVNAKYRNEKLENVLESFEFLLKINYTINDDGNVIIAGNGCN